MTREDLAATIDQRWAELSSGARSAGPARTIRPDTGWTTAMARSDTIAGPSSVNPQRLPHVSLVPAPKDGMPAAQPGPSSADLRITRTLGEGGMGRVHLARQVSLDRDVAVKTLKEGAPPSARAALLAEAMVTGSLEHPGIVPVHAVGIDDGGSPVLVMKRVEGVEWRQLIHDPDDPAWHWLPEGDDPERAHLEIFTRVCTTVHFAHSRGVVHRDIKPENVMIGRFGEAYLVDWGIATTPGGDTRTVCGTPGYLAPEMVLGGRVDARTDVYLLGATLHEILTRTFRHSGNDLHALLLAAALSEPVEYGADVPEELALLCNRATSRDPEQRPSSALEVRDAVMDYVRHRGSVTLTREAAGRLTVLRTLLDGSDPDRPLDSSTAHQVATECRFGFAQALREWPENPEALAGAKECLRAMVDMELRQGNAAGARALLAELSAPAPDLEGRLAALERSVQAREEREERLRILERDLDPRLGASQRAWAAGILLVMTTVVGVFAISRGGLDPAGVAAIGLVAVLTSVAVVIVLWRLISSNAFNRRIAAFGVLAAVSLLVDRLVSLASNMPMEQTLQRDLVLLSALTALGGITLSRPLIFATIVLLAALGASVVDPARASAYFSTAVAVALAGVGYAFQRQGAGDRRARAFDHDERPR